MRFIMQIISVLILCWNCSSGKKLVEAVPFKTGEAVYMVTEDQEVLTESTIQIPLLENNVEDISFEKVYFRGKIASVEVVPNNNQWTIIGRFKPVTLGKPDITMDLDPRKEVGNRPHQPREPFPFALTSEEYVLSYKKDQNIQ
ncbi:MAG: hypothetical protein AAGF77_09280, partial [Bacteroidota bacterium]